MSRERIMRRMEQSRAFAEQRRREILGIATKPVKVEPTTTEEINTVQEPVEVEGIEKSVEEEVVDNEEDKSDGVQEE